MFFKDTSINYFLQLCLDIKAPLQVFNNKKITESSLNGRYVNMNYIGSELI